MPSLTPEVLKSLPVWFVATLLSLTLHEAGHALLGRLGGDNTASDQVTLDPLPHIRREPFGMVAVPLLSFLLQGGGWMIGWASAPYDPVWARAHRRKAALMAAAGPLANLLLAALAACIIHIMIGLGHWAPAATSTLTLESVVTEAEGATSAMTTFVSVLFSVNVLIGLFNLLPVPPLDGHAIVPLFLSERLTERWFSLFEQRSAALVGLIVAWVIFGKIAFSVFVLALNVLYPGAGYSMS